jgi:hypothetical protein
MYPKGEIMSWFDQQPQPGTIGVQGGNPGFLPGEPNPAQTPGPFGTPSGQPWDEQIPGQTPASYPVVGQLGSQSTTGPQNGNYQQTYQQIMGGANDQASLLAHQQELEAAGFHISPPNASGAISKIQTPDGQWVRVIGEGEGHPVWIPQDGGTGSSVGSIGGMADGSLLTPWTQQFQAPDPNQIQNDPNYQFQLAQGLRGIQSGAASKGTLLTGGTLKSLDQFGQGLASSFNNTQYGRALGEYQLQKQNFQENQDRPYTKLSGLATLGKPQTIQPPTGLDFRSFSTSIYLNRWNMKSSADARHVVPLFGFSMRWLLMTTACDI